MKCKAYYQILYSYRKYSEFMVIHNELIFHPEIFERLIKNIPGTYNTTRSVV